MSIFRRSRATKDWPFSVRQQGTEAWPCGTWISNHSSIEAAKKKAAKVGGVVWALQRSGPMKPVA